MRLKTKIFSLLALCAVITFTGCGDKEDTSKNTLKPDAQKEELEKIGMSFMNQIKPTDFQPALVVLSDLIALLEVDEEPVPVPMQLKRIIEKRDLAALSAMAQPTSEMFNIAEYFGVYTYNYQNNQWDKTPSNSELKLIFKSGDAEATFRGVCSSETHIIETEEGNLTIPKSVTFTMSKGSTSLLQLEAGVPTLSMNEMKASTKASLTVGGVTMGATLVFEPTTCKATALMSKGSVSMISFTGNVKVNDFMNPDNLMLNSFDAKISLMNQCFLFANCPNYLSYLQGMAKIENDYPISSLGIYGEPKFRAQLALMNQSFNMFMNYDGSSAKAINMEIGGQYYFESYSFGNYQYQEEGIDMMPYFIFSDGSKHSGEEFFTETAFSDLIAKTGQLAQEFANMFGALQQ